MGGIKLRLAQFHPLKYGGRENEAVSISLAAVVLSITFALADAAVTSAAAKKIKAPWKSSAALAGRWKGRRRAAVTSKSTTSNAMTAIKLDKNVGLIAMTRD
jgi:hypothetical protein